MMKKKEEYNLRGWRTDDAQSLAENANNIKIWRGVRDYFPYPYTLDDAQKFIRYATKKPEPFTELAIEIDGKVVGAVGMVLFGDVERVAAEIGFWMGESYWGGGIMASAVDRASEYFFENFEIVKLFAKVYDYNVASQRVLLKAGYEREAILKKAAIKENELIDLHYFSRINSNYGQ